MSTIGVSWMVSDVQLGLFVGAQGFEENRKRERAENEQEVSSDILNYRKAHRNAILSSFEDEEYRGRRNFTNYLIILIQKRYLELTMIGNND